MAAAAAFSDEGDAVELALTQGASCEEGEEQADVEHALDAIAVAVASSDEEKNQLCFVTSKPLA
jgi:hypothetical protein